MNGKMLGNLARYNYFCKCCTSPSDRPVRKRVTKRRDQRQWKREWRNDVQSL